MFLPHSHAHIDACIFINIILSNFNCVLSKWKLLKKSVTCNSNSSYISCSNLLYPDMINKLMYVYVCLFLILFFNFIVFLILKTSLDYLWLELFYKICSRKEDKSNRFLKDSKDVGRKEVINKWMNLLKKKKFFECIAEKCLIMKSKNV